MELGDDSAVVAVVVRTVLDATTPLLLLLVVLAVTTPLPISDSIWKLLRCLGEIGMGAGGGGGVIPSFCCNMAFITCGNAN